MYDSAMVGVVLAAGIGLLGALVVSSAFGWIRDFAAAPTWPKLIHGAGQFAVFAIFLVYGWGAIEGNLAQGHQETLGIDGRLYYRAAQAWLTGGDPWTVYTKSNEWPSGCCIRFMFTGPPPTVMVFAPLTIIPEAIFVPTWMALTVAAAFYTLHRLKLPAWWILFPPLIQGVAVGNPQVVCLAVLLSGSDYLRALAVPLKAYAVFPLVGERRWRALAMLAAATVVAVVLAWPLWSQYIGHYATMQDWLVGTTYGGFSAMRDPTLFVVTFAAVGALALIDFRAAGWLAVPALWPASQFFYSSYALPLRSTALAVLLCLGADKFDAVIPMAICVYSFARLAQVIWRSNEPNAPTQLRHLLARVDALTSERPAVDAPALAVAREPALADPPPSVGPVPGRDATGTTAGAMGALAVFRELADDLQRLFRCGRPATGPGAGPSEPEPSRDGGDAPAS
jgi:hypothetical protein